MAEPDPHLHWICCWPAVETVLKHLACIVFEALAVGEETTTALKSLSPGKSMLYITTMSKYNFMDFFGSVLWNMNVFDIYSKHVVMYGLLQYQTEFPPPKWNIILDSPQNAILFHVHF